MAGEFMTFDEVIQELQLEPEDLKNMVSDEEIRAFRDAGLQKFKSDDVMALKRQRETQPTIILPAGEYLASTAEEEVEEAPVIAAIEEEVEEAPVIAGIEEEVEEAPVIAGIEEEVEEARVIAGIEEEEPVAATVPAVEEVAEEEIVPTMLIEEPPEEEAAATVELTPAGDIELVEEEALSPLDGTVGIELPEDLEAATVAQEEAEFATVIGEEDLLAGIEEEEPVAEVEAEIEEEPIVHAVSLPPEAPVSVSPIFNVMFIIGVLALIFAGVIVVDLVREPAEMPVYLKSICEVILRK